MIMFRSLLMQQNSPGLKDRIIDMLEVVLNTSFINCDGSSQLTSENRSCAFLVMYAAWLMTALTNPTQLYVGRLFNLSQSDANVSLINPSPSNTFRMTNCVVVGTVTPSIACISKMFAFVETVFRIFLLTYRYSRTYILALI